MATKPSSEAIAQVLLLFVVVAALNALRRGELGSWAAAKFLNRSTGPGPHNARASSSSSSSGGPPPGFATLGTIAAAAGAAAAAPAAPATGSSSSSSEPSGLVQVGTTKMSARFAARWRPMAAAAARDGVVLTGNAWRSNAQQIALREQHGCGGANLYNPNAHCTVPTATPGHSKHETGDAIDVTLTQGGGHGSPEYRWLAAHAGSFGIYNLPSEPWHWSIDGH